MQDPSAEPDRPATFKWERVCRRASMPVTKSEQTTSMTWLESHEQRASTDVHPTHMHPSYPCTHMHGSQSQESVSTSGDPQNIIKCTTSSIIYIGHGLHNTVSTHAIEQPWRPPSCIKYKIGSHRLIYPRLEGAPCTRGTHDRGEPVSTWSCNKGWLLPAAASFAFLCFPQPASSQVSSKHCRGDAWP